MGQGVDYLKWGGVKIFLIFIIEFFMRVLFLFLVEYVHKTTQTINFFVIK